MTSIKRPRRVAGEAVAEDREAGVAAGGVSSLTSGSGADTGVVSSETETDTD